LDDPFDVGILVVEKLGVTLKRIAENPSKDRELDEGSVAIFRALHYAIGCLLGAGGAYQCCT